MTSPRYPIYIPSKGRSADLLTARMFDRDRVPYRVVVEPSELDAYAKAVGRERVLILPDDGRGLVFSRNWIRDHAVAEGHVRHWQFDDDIRNLRRLHGDRKIVCAANVALALAEDFVDRYENVGLASLNSWFFVPTSGSSFKALRPFYLNARCYTCFLMLNSMPLRWRGRYNEDTDMTLQVLAAGWCTILFNAFTIETPVTMARPGGQTSIYVRDGRLKMARELERRWPGVVTVYRRFGRAQHKVAYNWQRFRTPLRRRPDADLSVGHEFALVAVREVENPDLARFAAASRAIP